MRDFARACKEFAKEELFASINKPKEEPDLATIFDEQDLEWYYMTEDEKKAKLEDNPHQPFIRRDSDRAEQDH